MDHAGNQINPQTPAQEDDPEVLKAKVQRTRAEINETVHSIQERLSPERVKHQVKEAARGRVESMKHQARMKADELRYQAQVKAEEWRYNINERISSNPLPAILAGVGVIWLMKQAVDAARDENTLYYKDDYYTLTPEEEWPEYRPEEETGRVGTAESLSAKGEAYSQEIRERGSQWKSQAQDYAGEWKSRAQNQTGRFKARAQAKAERAKGQFQTVLHDNPLAVGATVFAVGAAIGLSLPRTQREDEWLGETRDRLIEQAKSTAQEAGDKAKSIVGGLADEVKHSATAAAREQTAKTSGREEAGRSV